MPYNKEKKRESDKLRYIKNIKKIKQQREKYYKGYYAKNQEEIKLYNNQYRKDNPLKEKHFNRTKILKKYGLTPDKYDEMLKSQKGVCAICLNSETVKRKNDRIQALSVDHNHTTGKVRQLLCSSCNQAIGLLKENPLLVKSVADYLIKWNI